MLGFQPWIYAAPVRRKNPLKHRDNPIYMWWCRVYADPLIDACADHELVHSLQQVTARILSLELEEGIPVRERFRHEAAAIRVAPLSIIPTLQCADQILMKCLAI